MGLRTSTFFNTHVAWVSGFIAYPNTDEFMQLVGIYSANPTQPGEFIKNRREHDVMPAPFLCYSNQLGKTEFSPKLIESDPHGTRLSKFLPIVCRFYVGLVGRVSAA